MEIGKKKKIRTELTDDEMDRLIDVTVQDAYNDNKYFRSIIEEYVKDLPFETQMDDLYGDEWPEDCVEDE